MSSRKNKILPKDFYLSNDVVKISQELLGKVLITAFDQNITTGMIVETEAYHGIEDKASHAFNNRRTSRTEIMYQEGGVAYVYLCYGIHHLFNIVTGPQNTPHAVLIRAIEPLDGIPFMLQRRNISHLSPRLTAGPGMLTAALGITTKNTGVSLTENSSVIWVEDRKIKPSKKDILASPRIGIEYAEEHRHLPWRFRLRNSPWTSR